MRHTRGFLVAVVALFLLLALPVAAGSDFPVAVTVFVEQQPAIAYNSNTGQFLVAYKIQYTGVGGVAHYGVQCQLHNADGTKSGPVLYPFGDLGVIDALGRPALAFDKTAGIFFLAVVDHTSTYDRVIGRFMNGDGTNRIGPDWLFNGDSASSPFFFDGSGVGSLHVLFNELAGEFIVTVQRSRLHAQPVVERHMYHRRPADFGVCRPLRRRRACGLRPRGLQQPRDCVCAD